MRLADRLLSSYSFLGDPLHREAAEAIQRLVGDMETIVDAYHQHYDTKTMVDTAKQAVKEFSDGRETD
jgi:hypothetical protein